MKMKVPLIILATLIILSLIITLVVSFMRPNDGAGFNVEGYREKVREQRQGDQGTMKQDQRDAVRKNLFPRMKDGE